MRKPRGTRYYAYAVVCVIVGMMPVSSLSVPESVAAAGAVLILLGASGG